MVTDQFLYIIVFFLQNILRHRHLLSRFYDNLCDETKSICLKVDSIVKIFICRVLKVNTITQTMGDREMGSVNRMYFLTLPRLQETCGETLPRGCPQGKAHETT